MAERIILRASSHIYLSHCHCITFLLAHPQIHSVCLAVFPSISPLNWLTHSFSQMQWIRPNKRSGMPQCNKLVNIWYSVHSPYIFASTDTYTYSHCRAWPSKAQSPINHSWSGFRWHKVINNRIKRQLRLTISVAIQLGGNSTAAFLQAVQTGTLFHNWYTAHNAFQHSKCWAKKKYIGFLSKPHWSTFQVNYFQVLLPCLCVNCWANWVKTYFWMWIY